MTKIFTVIITNGYIGCEQHYLVSEHDYLEDICYSENVTDSFRSYIGMYPSVDEFILDGLDNGEDEMSWDEANVAIDDIVHSDIEYTTKLATIEDLNYFSVLPESSLYEDCEEMQDYRTMLVRDVTIDSIIN
tara:strand:- start:66702 stop:67097 length:396 start_codon:yes stop_codon:yes gene_type:complete